MALAAGFLLFLSPLGRVPAVPVVAAIAAGGAVAGRVAGRAGALHGGLVAVLWIAAEALSDPFFPAARDPLADAALTVVTDALGLGIGALCGWLGAASGRTGTGGGAAA